MNIFLLQRLLKYNPYHDSKGRFTSSGNAHFMSTGSHFASSISKMKEEHAKQLKEAEAKSKVAFSKYKIYPQHGLELDVASRKLVTGSEKQYNSMKPFSKLAIKEYTGSYYLDLNPALAGAKSMSNYDKKMANSIDEGLHKMEAPTNMKVFKAMNLNHFFKDSDITTMSDPAKVRKALEGKVFQDPAVGSTSIRADVAKGFLKHDRSLVVIDVPKGAKGGYFGEHSGKSNSEQRSNHPSEHEFILPRGRKYMVTKVTVEKVPQTDSKGRVTHKKMPIVHIKLLNPQEKMPEFELTN